VTAFTAIANQYQRYMRQTHPHLIDDATVIVREVRLGSIIADLIPNVASLIGVMDQGLIVEQFKKFMENASKNLSCLRGDKRTLTGRN
jgi:hypothetical protein